MARPKTVSDALGRVAFLRAQARYLAWLAEDWGKVDRAAFTRLARDAEALAGALDVMTAPMGDPTNQARLIFWLTYPIPHSSFRTREDPRQWLMEFRGRLARLEDAASKEAHTTGGKEPDRHAKVWIFFAADEWFKATGKVPAAGGRFMDALQTFETENRRVPGLPPVTKEIAAPALQDWNARREADS